MQDDFYSYAKTHYFAEIERKKELASNVTISAGVASLIGGGIYALAFRTPIISSTVGAISYAGLAFASVTLIVGIYCLVRSHVGHSYKHTAGIENIVAARMRGSAVGYTSEQVGLATKLLIEEQYIECVGFNERANDAKSGWLHRGNKALVTTIAIVFGVGAVTVVSHVAQQLGESKTHGTRARDGQQARNSGDPSSATGPASNAADQRQ
jgi:hypothetical protein